jgi:hypothetical protein
MTTERERELIAAGNAVIRAIRDELAAYPVGMTGPQLRRIVERLDAFLAEYSPSDDPSDAG